MQIFRQKNEKFFQQPKFCPPRPRNCMAIRGYKQSAFCNAFFCPKSCKCQKFAVPLQSLSRSARRSHRMALGAIKATPASAFPHQNIAMQVLLGTPGIENDYTCARLQESNNRLTKKRALPSQKSAHCIRYQKNNYTRMPQCISFIFSYEVSGSRAACFF